MSFLLCLFHKLRNGDIAQWMLILYAQASEFSLRTAQSRWAACRVRGSEVQGHHWVRVGKLEVSYAERCLKINLTIKKLNLIIKLG